MSVGIFGLFIVALLFSFLGVLLHESTHWIIARIWTEDVTIGSSYDRVPFPDRTEFKNPWDLPDYGVRIAGISPIIYLFLFLYTMWGYSGDITLYSTAPLFFFLGASIISIHDMMAFLFPERWRELTDSEEEYSQRQVVSFLFQEIRKSN